MTASSLDTLSRDLCHDISGPLTSILVNCELLMDGNCPSPVREKIEVALLLALESRERGTHLHSVRVQAFAMMLAERCGYRGADLLQLGYGALLHDIGKILIPESLLLKPGRLSEQEMRIVQQHPSRGYQFLWRFPRLREAAVLALCHHERMDGAGYPLRLRGKKFR